MEAMVTTLSDQLRRQAQQFPDHDFLREPGRDLGYLAADQRVDQIAAGLQALGVAVSDRVVLLMSNCIEQVLVWLALNRIGAQHIPLNNTLSIELLARSMELVRPKLVVADSAVADVARASIAKYRGHEVTHVLNGSPVAADPGQIPAVCISELNTDLAPQIVRPAALDPATMLFTSGSTGLPKACVLSHRYLVRAGEIHAHYLGLRQDDVLFTPFPLFHIDAATLTVSAALAAGATAALTARFSASKFWNEVRSCGATVFNFMGATANILWKQEPTARDKDHCVRLAWGVPMPSCEPEWQARFGFPLVEVYGLTDAGLPAYQPLGQPRRSGSCGKVIDEYEVRIANEAGEMLPAGLVGEILIRAKEPGLLMTEYFGMPEATGKALRGGWFHTGDMGRLDDEGYLYFVARGSEVIRRRGENIAATDVEEGANSHPGVRESAAVGVPSELTEDDIKIFVVAQPGTRLDPDQVWAHCRETLPRHMVPRYVEVVPELPKTPTQKIERGKLRDRKLNSATWDAEASGRHQPAVA